MQEEIENQFGPIVAEFKIPRVGWEMDGVGWICESKTKRNVKGEPVKIIVLTSHNEPYIAKKSDLERIINNLTKSLKEIQTAFRLTK